MGPASLFFQAIKLNCFYIHTKKKDYILIKESLFYLNTFISEMSNDYREKLENYNFTRRGVENIYMCSKWLCVSSEIQ